MTRSPPEHSAVFALHDSRCGISMKISILLALIVAALVAVVIVQHQHLAHRPEGAATMAMSKPKQLWHCGMHPQVIQDHPGDCPICHMALTPLGSGDASAQTGTGGPMVTIDPTVVQNMGIRTAPVTRGPLTRTIRAVGLIKLPEPGQHDIALKIGGWIDK